jgi:hypothetical protein
MGELGLPQFFRAKRGNSAFPRLFSRALADLASTWSFG